MNANLALCHRVVTNPKPKSRSQNPNSETKTRNYPKTKLPKSQISQNRNYPHPKLIQIPKPKTIPKSQNSRPNCFG